MHATTRKPARPYTYPNVSLYRRLRVLTEPSPAPSSPTGFAPRALPPFRELYEKHFAFTWRSLRYLGVPESQLDDAVQDLWVTVHRRLADFEARSDLRTWLFGIAVNLQRNLRRSESRRAELVPLPEQLTSPLADPSLEHDGQEAWRQVQAFLGSLDDVRRAIFVASLLEGLSPAETAEATGLEVSAIYHRVRSLRQSFQLWIVRERGAQ